MYLSYKHHSCKSHGSLPENNGCWRVSHQRLPKNHVKIKCIRHIITWCPTSISILKRVTALIILRRADSGGALQCRSAHWIWAWHQCSSWWASSIKEIELNLHQKTKCKYKIASLCHKIETMKGHHKNKLRRQNLTPSALDWGQSLQELQVTHKMSLPVSICTLNSFGGEPNFTFVK